MKTLTIKKEDAILVAIDFQEKLIPAMYNAEELEATAAKLGEGMKVLGIPMLVSQQYTKGLGATVESISTALGDFEPIEKNAFNAFGSEEFTEKLEKSGKKTVILCGIEAHICVQQTALELISRGYSVFVVADCISSRKESNCNIAMRRMEQAGCVITNYESVLYEVLGSSKAPEFKAISAIVK